MSLVTAISTVTDGSMKSPDRNFRTVLPARTTFLKKYAIAPEDTTLVHLTYEGDDFCRYMTLSDDYRGDGITRVPSIETDALVVTETGHALFLPLADCIGVVIHDPTRSVMMVAHLGRHNLEQYSGTKCIQYLVSEHGINPHDLTVWLSPAAGKSSYPLFAFNNRSLHDVATEQLIAAGIPLENIDVSPTDSATDEQYFSHSQFLKGNRESDGRHAIIAVMR